MPSSGPIKTPVPAVLWHDHPCPLPMEEMAARHQVAVTDLYERYGVILKSVVSGVIKNKAQAENLVQDVFLQLYREAIRESFDGRGHGQVLPSG